MNIILLFKEPEPGAGAGFEICLEPEPENQKGPAPATLGKSLQDRLTRLVILVKWGLTKGLGQWVIVSVEFRYLYNMVSLSYNVHTEPYFKTANILPFNILLQFFNPALPEPVGAGVFGWSRI